MTPDHPPSAEGLRRALIRGLKWTFTEGVARTGELSLYVDREKKAATRPNPNTQRVIDPRELRLMVYGTIQSNPAQCGPEWKPRCVK